MKRALISVTNKENIVEFAKKLDELGFEIISTGNTQKIIQEAGINAIKIDEVTGFPEILDGRVKTLHPKVHGAILHRRDLKSHVETVEKMGLGSIDIVCVNLYEFEKALRANKAPEEMIEEIDIGGPSMIRSAAKNFKDVLVVTDPSDYDEVIERLKTNTDSYEFRRKLAFKAFSATGAYDSMISRYFARECEEEFPEILNISLKKQESLRYGENPHQEASRYVDSYLSHTPLDFEKLNGKELSFNNINDLHGALSLLREFQEPAVVAVKHSTPCAVALGEDVEKAYQKAYEADPLSIFGGIVVSNRKIDSNTAKKMNEIFLEIVAAPEFEDEALQILSQKKNLRILKLASIRTDANYDIKYLEGEVLVQSKDTKMNEYFKIVTQKSPSQSEIEDMDFGMKIAKHMKSNAIAIVKDKKTLALCGGQTSRIWALQNAIRNNDEKDMTGAVLASDAFFPFSDCVEEASKVGIKAIVQPGGSTKDQVSIDACDELNISMVFTGMRHFKH